MIRLAHDWVPGAPEYLASSGPRSCRPCGTLVEIKEDSWKPLAGPTVHWPTGHGHNTWSARSEPATRSGCSGPPREGPRSREAAVALLASGRTLTFLVRAAMGSQGSFATGVESERCPGKTV